MKSLLVEGLGRGIAELRLANFPADEFGENRVHIHHIAALVKGGGRQALSQIIKNANILGITLSLNACPLRTDLYDEPLETPVLVGWYEKFGFKRAVPRVAIDTTRLLPSATSSVWLHMSHLMVRNA